METNDLTKRIRHGETEYLEFKSTLRWNIHKKGSDKEVENAVLKTIVAFCNTRGGGLLIGVADEGNILGLDRDGFPNANKFLLHLRNLLADRIVPKIFSFIEYEMIDLGGKTICRVSCKSSTRGVWLQPDKKTEHFYVRTGPYSTELMPREAVEYITDHFKK